LTHPVRFPGRPGAALAAFALAVVCHAGATHAAEGRGPKAARGPLDIRDDHLLAQGRLTLPAVSPRTVPSGTWSVETSLVWSNSFSWTQDAPGEDPEDRRFLVDGETQTLATTVRRGLGPDLDVALRLPVHHRGGGILDGLIDVWHRWLNLPDGARPRFRRDAYRLEGRTTADDPFSWTDESGAGLGNVELSARWRALGGGAHGFSAALVGRLQLPTATGPNDGNGLGAAGQIVVAAPLGRTVEVYLGAGLTVQDPGPVRGVAYERTRGHGFAALEWRPWSRLSLVVETGAATRLVANIDSYPGVHWLVNVEGRVALTGGLCLDLGLTENLIDQQSTTDLGLFFGLGWRP
jgi:hypothetical protein